MKSLFLGKEIDGLQDLSFLHVQLCSMQHPAAGQTSLFTASSNFKMQWCTGVHTEFVFFFNVIVAKLMAKLPIQMADITLTCLLYNFSESAYQPLSHHAIGLD